MLFSNITKENRTPLVSPVCNYAVFSLLFTIGVVDRDKETVSSPPTIVFCVVQSRINHSALLKGIPKQPLRKPLDQQILFGRGRSAGVFLNDDSASREHMTLYMQTNPATGENIFVVSTVSESEPVYINGTPFHRKAGTRVLQTNDKLRIGQLEFIVNIMPGDSTEFYQVEFTKGSKGNLQQLNLPRQVNYPQIQGQAGINTQPIFLANHPGAAILPNNYGVPVPGAPVNPVFNMNISAGGGVTQFNPMGAAFQGNPASFAVPPVLVNPGIGQGSLQVQQFPENLRCQGITPSFQPQQESQYSGMYQQERVLAHDRRQMCHTKLPSEQNEDPKQTGPDGVLHVSIEESGLQKT